MQIAPVVLFVYNRPEHTRQTLESLANNKYASDSKLIIYSDAPKNPADKQAVSDVRHLIRSIKGFKSVEIIEQDENRGLAQSIIHGVTEVINHYGSAIVLEDDLVTSPFFLKFINEALDYYKDEPNVWHIAGWNYPIPTGGLEDTFLWRGMNCWGWGTWADRWQHFHKDVEQTVNSFSTEEIYRFNIDGTEKFWRQVLQNKSGQKNTWAIFWYATIFKHGGLCLNPAQSFVRNIGFDGSGSHVGIAGNDKEGLWRNSRVTFTGKVKEHEEAVKRIKAYYRRENSIPRKILRLARDKKRALLG